MSIEGIKRARRLSISNQELLIATSENDLKKVEELLDSGADVNFQDQYGNSALHVAIECGNVKAVELLISKGASTQSKNNIAETPLDIGERKRSNYQQIIDILRLSIPPPSTNKETPEGSQESKSEVSISSPTEVQNSNEEQAINECTLERTKYLQNENMYQFKLLILFLHRGFSRKYSFHLNMEIQEANELDNLVFRYDVEGKRIYRFINAKLSLDKSKMINTRNLLIQNDGDYSLVKYFFSYLELKKNDLFSEGSIKDVIICTNIDFDVQHLKKNGIIVEKIVEKDEILDVRSEKEKSTRYKFGGDIVQKLKLRLQSSSPPTSTKTDVYTDNDIAEFIKCLVFAVYQPNENKLDNIVKHELSQEFHFAASERFYDATFMSILNWLQNKKQNNFLSYEDMKNFFVEYNKSFAFMVFGIRDPTESFFGRSEILTNLHMVLTLKKFVCISGLSGVGKSELARKYVNTYRLEYDYQIIWINAESYETLADSFHVLACNSLKIRKVNECNSVIKDVYAFFSDKKCLFIFDNAKKYMNQHEFDDGIQEFLPSRSFSNIHVIITSRDQNWPMFMHILMLNEFSESEATEFVKKSLNLTGDDQIEDIKKLVNELQFFPLALQQAVTYVALQDRRLKNVGSEFKISNYLEKLEQESKEDFKFTTDNDIDYSKAIYYTWNIKLNAIRQNENGTEACEVLEMLAYFAQTDIDTYLQTVKDLLGDEIKFIAALEMLKQYSIIDVEGAILSLHRSVIKVIMLHIQGQKNEQEILCKALNFFSTALTRENVDYAVSVWNYSSKYCNLIDEFSSLPSGILNMLLKEGMLQKAASFGIKALKQLDALIYKSHAKQLDVISTTKLTATALLLIRRTELAAKFYENAFEMQKKTFGPKSIEAVDGITPGIVCLFNSEQYDRALALIEEIIEIQSETIGKNHFETSETLDFKALILLKQNKADEGLSVLEEAHSIRELFPEKTHSELYLSLKVQIAESLFLSDQLDKAVKICNEILSKVTDPTDPDGLNAKYIKTAILIKQAKGEEFLPLLREAISVQELLFGQSNIETLKLRINIANLLNYINKKYSAFKIYRELLDTIDNKTLKYCEIETLKYNTCRVKSEIDRLFMMIETNDYISFQKSFDKGHEVDTADYDNSTLLHHAARHGRFAMIKILLKNGADVTLVNTKSNTALHEAATNGCLRIIKLLLQYGSMYDVRNEEGATPLDLCKNNKARSFLTSVGRIFEDASKGDARIFLKLNDFQSDELEAVQNTRNSRRKTFLQVIFRRGHGFFLLKLKN